VDRLWDSIESFLAEERVELDDLELSGRTLRVVIDSDGGLDLDHITEVSRGVSRLLDESDDLVPESYNLEVTSPGLERTLRRPRHFEKAVGRSVKVKTTAGQTVRGRLTGVSESGFVVTSDTTEVPITFGEVARARTLFEATAKPKPGKKR
jgi:ribosome maturation factor RimP